MEALQQEVQTAIQKFQEQGREIVEAEFKQELDVLKQELVSKNKRLKFLEQENTKLKNGYHDLNNTLGVLVSDIISKSISDTFSLTDEKGLPLPLETKESELHSIKDRIKLGETNARFPINIAKPKVIIPMPPSLLESERKRLAKEEEKLEKNVHQLHQKLSNQNFIEKAPEKLVLQQRSQLKEVEEKLQAVQEKRHQLEKS